MLLDPNALCLRCMTVLPNPNAFCPNCGRTKAQLSNLDDQLPLQTILAGRYLLGCVLRRDSYGNRYAGYDLQRDARVILHEYFPRGLAVRSPNRQVSAVNGEQASVLFYHGVQRTLSEARAMARISAPGFAEILDSFTENGTAYVATRFYEGMPLDALLSKRGGKLNGREALPMLRPVGEALSALHEAGLVYGDVRPESILVEPGGSAILLDACPVFHTVGDIAGTPYGPEELNRPDGRVGPWTDLYSFCAVLYRVLTGVTPPLAKERTAGGQVLVPPKPLGSDISGGQQVALLKGLSLYPADRQLGMGQLMGELYGQPADPLGAAESTISISRRHKKKTARIVCIAGAAIALLTLAVLLIPGKSLNEKPESPKDVYGKTEAPAQVSASPTPKSSGKPALTPEPADTAAPAPDTETLRIGGMEVTAYVADVSKLEYDAVCRWSDKQETIGSSVGCPMLLLGDIHDSYGIGFYYQATVKKGDPFSAPWKAMLKLENNSWTRGQGETAFTYTGGEQYLEVLLEKPAGFSQVVTLPTYQINSDWSISDGIDLAKVFFATPEARDAYLNSIG